MSSQQRQAVFTETTPNLAIAGSATTDKMKLFIMVERRGEGTAPIESKEILEALSRQLRAKDFDLGVIDDIVACLNRGEKQKEARRIMQGVPEQTGADGKLLLLKKKYTGKGEIVESDSQGRADLTKLHLFDNVQKGDIVGRIYPPKAGIPGRNVFGAPIPAKAGAPTRVATDSSLTMKQAPAPDNFQNVIADKDGYLAERDGRLCISDELVIKGDLDYRYGSLEFIGRVKIRGDVLPGFNVNAKLGIEVLGSVRSGSLISAEGDITVNGFVFGGEGARIVCGKDFKASLVQQIDGEVLGSIFIDKEARESTMRTQHMLRMPKGVLAGGTVLTVGGAEVGVLGSEGGIVTKIALCSDVEATTAYAKNEVEIKNHERALQLLKLHLGPYADNPARIKLLAKGLQDKMERFRAKMVEVEHSLLILLAEKKRMVESAHTLPEARINILAKAYEGAEVSVGEHTLQLHGTLAGPASIEYNANTQEISVVPYRELPPPVSKDRKK